LPAAAVGESSDRAARILALERNVVLPVRLLLIVALGYYAFFAGWFSVPGASNGSDWVQRNAPVLRGGFIAYALVNLALGAILIWGKRLTLARIVWVVFAAGVLDCVLMGTLTFVCEPSGFDTKLYAVFAVLILHNAIAIPAAFPQLLLNFLTIVSFIAGGILDTAINPRPPFLDVESSLHENPVERAVVLITWALCCWGIQMLFDQRNGVETELVGSARATPTASHQATPAKSLGGGWKKVAGVLAAVMLVFGLGWAYRASRARRAELEAIKNRQFQRIDATTARKGDIGRRVAAVGTVESSNSVVFAIDERYCQEVIRKFDARQILTVDATTTDGASFGQGFLSGVDNLIDTSTGTLKCKATLIPEGGNLMVPGLLLNISLLLEMKHGVTLAPTAAVQREPQSEFVWVIQTDQTVRRRPVRLGTTGGDWTEIQSGLAPGEIVAISGFNTLSEGLNVRYALASNTEPPQVNGQDAGKASEWLRIQPLAGWITDLQNQDPKVQKMAELALTEMGTNTLPEILKILSEANQSPADDTRRFNTAQALKFMGGGARSGLPAFTALLESGQFPAAYSGARALAFSAPAVPEAFSILTNGLRDSSAGVRVAASHGVGLCFNTETNNDAEPALPLLLSNLSDKDKDVRLATANALMLYAQHQSFHFPPLDAKPDLLIPPLIELLRDNYSYVRETAIYTLTDACFRDGLTRWIPAIQKLLDNPDEGVRQSATNLLQRLNVTAGTNSTLSASQMPILSVQATGTNPLSYQWYFIPTNGPDATNAAQK
jgi:HEAT repeat protein